MIKFSIKYIIPEGNFCETKSRRGTNGERTLKLPIPCFHVLRSYDHNPDTPNPIEVRCSVFNMKLHHEPGVGVYKCSQCRKIKNG